LGNDIKSESILLQKTLAGKRVVLLFNTAGQKKVGATTIGFGA
jgi:hypothetical protein